MLSYNTKIALKSHFAGKLRDYAICKSDVAMSTVASRHLNNLHISYSWVLLFIMHDIITVTDTTSYYKILSFVSPSDHLASNQPVFSKRYKL